MKTSFTARVPIGDLTSLEFAYSLRGLSLRMILKDLDPAPTPSSLYSTSRLATKLYYCYSCVA